MIELVILSRSSSILVVLCRFLYSDEVQIGPETVMTTLYTAKKYAVPALEAHCVEFLKKNLRADNAFMLLTQVGSNFSTITKSCVQFDGMYWIYRCVCARLFTSSASLYKYIHAHLYVCMHACMHACANTESSFLRRRASAMTTQCLGARVLCK